MKTIGVFDSGVGGLSVTNAIKKALPNHTVIYREDSKNVPYGTKSKKELLGLVLPILTDMATECDVIVVACNTVSTVLISELREKINVPLIAMEPMIKPAASETMSGIVAVCATPMTLTSDRYAWLVKNYANHLSLLEPDCSTWSYMIEADKVNRQYIENEINSLCDQGVDVIVLGCTHYHWIEDLITKTAAGRAKVLQPERPVISQLAAVLSRLD